MLHIEGRVEPALPCMIFWHWGVGATWSWLISEGLRDITAIDIRVEGTELRWDAFCCFNPSITSSDRIGDCSPPFIGSSTVGKHNQESPQAFVINLLEVFPLVLGSPQGLTMTTYMFSICINEYQHRRHGLIRGKLVQGLQLVQRKYKTRFTRVVKLTLRWGCAIMQVYVILPHLGAADCYPLSISPKQSQCAQISVCSRTRTRSREESLNIFM